MFGLGPLTSTWRFRVLIKKRPRGNLLISLSKWSRSESKALQALMSLLTVAEGSCGLKGSKEIGSGTL